MGGHYLNSKWVLYLIVISSSFFMSGCVKGVANITVNKDGSADVIYDIAFDTALLSLSNDNDNPLNELRQIGEKDGYSITQFKENGFVGISAKKHVSTVQEVWNGEFINQLLGENEYNIISLNQGFFSDSYKLNTKINLPGEQDSGWINTMFLSQTDFKLKLTFPIEAEQHNASRIELLNNKSGFNTYVWDIIPNQNNELLFEAKAYNVANIIYTVIGGLILGSLIFYFIRKYRLSSR